jgi:7-cyano-7-deazaguanine synthase
MPDCLLLATSGLDSTTLAYHLLAEGRYPLPLYIDYGQHCADMEWANLGAVLPDRVRTDAVRLNMSDVYAGTSSRLIAPPDLWDEKVVDEELYLPHRNLLLLAAAAAYAESRGIGEVFAGFINAEKSLNADATPGFIGCVTEILGEYGAVTLQAPFATMTKAEVARLAQRLGVNIGLTYSCQVHPSVPCGACPNCTERLQALAELHDQVGE